MTALLPTTLLRNGSAAIALAVPDVLVALFAIAGWVSEHALLIAMLFIGGVLATDVIRTILRRRREPAQHDQAHQVILRPPPEADLESGDAFWRHLRGLVAPAWKRWLYGQPHVAWEYTWIGRQLTLSVWVPAGIPPTLVADAATAAWPGTTTRVTRATTPPIPVGAPYDGGRLVLATGGHLPLTTDYTTDPLRGLLAACGDGKDTEHSVVQVLARPLPSTTGGRPATRANLVRALVIGLLDLVDPTVSRTRTSATSRTPIAARQQRAAVDKQIAPSWEVSVQYGVAVATPAGGRPPQDPYPRLAGRAHAIASAFAVYSGHNWFKRRRDAAIADHLAQRRLRGASAVSTTELAALAHVPIDAAVAELDRANARPIAPPAAATITGPDRKRLGNGHGGRPVTLSVEAARHHIHAIGTTGRGKSTLLSHMVLEEARAKRGVVLLDPRGDLVDDILDRLPASAADRVVLIDPAQPKPRWGWNPLDGDPDIATDQLCGVFTQVFGKFWGPRADDTLRSSCLTLTRHSQANLSMIPALLSNKAIRGRFTADLDDPDGLGSYWTWYESLSVGMQAQVIGPVLSRLRAFLLRDFVKQTIGKPYTTLDFRQVLDRGGILLARLPKGILGTDTCQLLGSLLVARIWQTVTARSAVPETERPDCTLILDEAGNFLNMPRSLDEIAAEARGYHLSMVLAHQHNPQFSRETQAAISANARTKVFFGVSPEDASTLEKHVEPLFTKYDLTHPDPYTAICRTVVDGGSDSRPFTLRTIPPAPIAGQAKVIRQRVADRAQEATTRAQQAVKVNAKKATRRHGLPRPRVSPENAESNTMTPNRDRNEDVDPGGGDDG